MTSYRPGLSLGENTCRVGKPIKIRTCSQLPISQLWGKKGQGLKSFLFGLELAIARGNREWPGREHEAIHDHLLWKPSCRVHRTEMARIETSYFTPGIQITVVTGIITSSTKMEEFYKVP